TPLGASARAPGGRRVPSARWTTRGWLAHVAVTATPALVMTRWADDARGATPAPLPTGGRAGARGWALPAARPESGCTRIDSVRPTAWAGQRCSGLGWPR